MSNRVMCIKDRVFFGAIIHKKGIMYNILKQDDFSIEIETEYHTNGDGFGYSLIENEFVQFNEYFIRLNVLRKNKLNNISKKQTEIRKLKN